MLRQTVAASSVEYYRNTLSIYRIYQPEVFLMLTNRVCFKFEISCPDSIQMMQKAFGDDWMGKTQIKVGMHRYAL